MDPERSGPMPPETEQLFRHIDALRLVVREQDFENALRETGMPSCALVLGAITTIKDSSKNCQSCYQSHNSLSKKCESLREPGEALCRINEDVISSAVDLEVENQELKRQVQISQSSCEFKNWQLESKKCEVDCKKGEVDKKLREIEYKNWELESVKQQANYLASQLGGKDHQIAILYDQIHPKNLQISHLVSLLREKDQRIATLHEHIKTNTEEFEESLKEMQITFKQIAEKTSHHPSKTILPGVNGFQAHSADTETDSDTGADADANSDAIADIDTDTEDDAGVDVDVYVDGEANANLFLSSSLYELFDKCTALSDENSNLKKRNSELRARLLLIE